MWRIAEEPCDVVFLQMLSIGPVRLRILRHHHGKLIYKSLNGDIQVLLNALRASANRNLDLPRTETEVRRQREIEREGESCGCADGETLEKGREREKETTPHFVSITPQRYLPLALPLALPPALSAFRPSPSALTRSLSWTPSI